MIVHRVIGSLPYCVLSHHKFKAGYTRSRGYDISMYEERVISHKNPFAIYTIAPKMTLLRITGRLISSFRNYMGG